MYNMNGLLLLLLSEAIDFGFEEIKYLTILCSDLRCIIL